MVKEVYYTPTIEEFHVGFECERRIAEDLIEWESYTVTGATWSSNAMWSMVRDNPTLFRVKYLNKEDIESLGFTYCGTREYHTRNGVEESGFMKKLEDDSNVYIKCFLDPNGIVNSDLDITSTDIYTYETSTPWDAYCEGGCGPSARQIIIKNKSALKVLLNQLNLVN